jgi:hypothetical protein
MFACFFGERQSLVQGRQRIVNMAGRRLKRSNHTMEPGH